MYLFKPIRAHIAGALLCAAALAGVTGCTATVTATPARSAVLYDHDVVYVDDAPSDVYDRPSAYYRGRPAYLVGARWYYPSDGGWVYFNDEPSELQRARTTRTFVRVDSDATRGRYVDRRPERRRAVEQPSETRRRSVD
jgi:hypothetical protein